jgi:N-acyl-phosphatidylethanolamine-hydrolysing phospholipase D
MKQSYTNPWPSYKKPSLFHLLTHLLDTSPTSPHTAAALPDVHVANFEEAVTDPRMMWLGHASCYLQLPTTVGTFGVLFDPIFSDRYVISLWGPYTSSEVGEGANDRCSPSRIFGPKRRMPPPCRVQDILQLDLVIISHDHCMSYL